MNLFEINKDKLNIYNIKENKERMFNFKKSEMEKFPEHLRVLHAITNTTAVLQLPKSEMEWDEIEFFDKTGDNVSYHILAPGMSIMNTNMLNKYYNNLFSYSSSQVRINNSRNPQINYLLLSGRNYTYVSKENRGELSNIINVSKELYNLELFLSKKYDKLTDDEIIGILNLLYEGKELISSISLQDIKRAYEFNLVEGYENIVPQANRDSKVLKLLK